MTEITYRINIEYTVKGELKKECYDFDFSESDEAIQRSKSERFMNDLKRAIFRMYDGVDNYKTNVFIFVNNDV
jgi:hypothetical protein